MARWPNGLCTGGTLIRSGAYLIFSAWGGGGVEAFAVIREAFILLFIETLVKALGEREMLWEHEP